MNSPFHWWERTASLAEQRSWEYFLDRLRLIRLLASAAELSLLPESQDAPCPETPRIFERRTNSNWVLQEGTTPQEVAPWLEAEFAAEVIDRAHRFATRWEARLHPLALRRLGADRIRDLIAELPSAGNGDETVQEDFPRGHSSPAPGRLRPLWSEFLSLPELQLSDAVAGAAGALRNDPVPERLSGHCLEAESACCSDLADAASDSASFELASQVRHLRMLARLESAILRRHPSLAPRSTGQLPFEMSLRRSPHAGDRCRFELRSRQ